jgi:hypothetical protein
MNKEFDCDKEKYENKINDYKNENKSFFKERIEG